MDRLSLSGLVVVDVNGRRVAEGRNLVTTVGKELAAAILAASGTRPSHFGFGTGGSPTVPPAESQTALAAEFSGGWYGRHAFTTTRTTNVITYVTQGSHFVNGSGGSLSLGEIGIFNASTSGTMFARFLTSPYTLAVSDAVRVSWALTVG